MDAKRNSAYANFLLQVQCDERLWLQNRVQPRPLPIFEDVIDAAGNFATDGGNGWTRNSPEEISLFQNKINGLMIFVGGVNVACDFTASTLAIIRNHSSELTRLASIHNDAASQGLQG